MAHQDRGQGSGSGTDSPKGEVVRLSVSGSDLRDQLEAMPAPKRGRLQPARQVHLMEEEGEDPIEPTLAERGMGWEEVDGEKRQTPVGWLVLIGVILLGLGGWALGKLSKGEANLSELAERVEAGWKEEERKRAEALDLLSRIEEVLAAYLQADEVAEKANYVRQRERVHPLMEAYYQRHPLTPKTFERITNMEPIGLETRSFVLIEVALEGEEDKANYFIEQTLEGELKFDWESEVAYQPMDLEEYLEKKPTEAMDFRVYARLDNFYAFEFSDRERYQALLLRARDPAQYLFGYIERGTKQERELTTFLRRELTRGRPVMLRLRFLPDTMARRSVLVEKVLAPRWVHIKPPAGEED